MVLTHGHVAGPDNGITTGGATGAVIEVPDAFFVLLFFAVPAEHLQPTLRNCWCQMGEKRERVFWHDLPSQNAKRSGGEKKEETFSVSKGAGVSGGV